LFNSFNPRAREGRDEAAKTNNTMHDVSIHAPAKDATVSTSQKKHLFYSFNPRAREGRDPGR